MTQQKSKVAGVVFRDSWPVCLRPECRHTGGTTCVHEREAVDREHASRDRKAAR
jgi:hypothetical protein